MKIKFIKDYAINRGACPLDIGGFDALEAEIVKANTVVDLKEDNDDDAFNDELVKWLIDNGFAEEVKESGWWEPERDEHYYFVTPNGDVVSVPWLGADIDWGRLIMGNCFQTVDAVNRWRDYLKAIATVRQDEGVLTPEEIREMGQSKAIVYTIAYIGEKELSNVTCDLFDVYPCAGAVYFDTKEHAQNSLDKHKNEWKIIANYDWSRE